MRGDFGMLPLSVICDRRLSEVELRVLAFHLVVCERTSMVSRWSQIEVARHLCAHRKSVNRAEHRLAELGLLRVESTGGSRRVVLLEAPALRVSDLERDAAPRVAEEAEPVTPVSHPCNPGVPGTPTHLGHPGYTPGTSPSPTCNPGVPPLGHPGHTDQREQEQERAEQRQARARVHAREDVEEVVGAFDRACRRHPRPLTSLGTARPTKVLELVAARIDEYGLEPLLESCRVLEGMTDEDVGRACINNLDGFLRASKRSPDLGPWCWRLSQGDPTTRWSADEQRADRRPRHSAAAPPEARASPTSPPAPLTDADRGWLQYLEGSVLLLGTPPPDRLRAWWARNRELWTAQPKDPGQPARLDAYIEQLAKDSTQPGQDGHGITTTDGRDAPPTATTTTGNRRPAA